MAARPQAERVPTVIENEARRGACCIRRGWPRPEDARRRGRPRGHRPSASLPRWTLRRNRHGATYSTISVTTPAPTVRPPSRIANRNPFSSAIGVINSTAIATLSPGITISTPAGNVQTPVTSVVRK
jgi:hypothetical protein